MWIFVCYILWQNVTESDILWSMCDFSKPICRKFVFWHESFLPHFCWRCDNPRVLENPTKIEVFYGILKILVLHLLQKTLICNIRVLLLLQCWRKMTQNVTFSWTFLGVFFYIFFGMALFAPFSLTKTQNGSFSTWNAMPGNSKWCRILKGKWYVARQWRPRNPKFGTKWRRIFTDGWLRNGLRPEVFVTFCNSSWTMAWD